MASADETPSAMAVGRRSDERALRILVVSDIRLFQEAFAALLGRECSDTVIGTATPPQASAIAAELQPDIVLLDVTRHGNLDCAKAFVERQPALRIVAFGVTETDAEIVALASAGIAGYVRNDATAEDVMAVLASAMRDEFLCPPRVAAALCHRVAVLSRNGQAGSPPATLSKRELQIASLIDRGLSNKEIARQLGIQAATVKNHVHNILDKLKVHRRGEAAACLRAALASRSSGPAPTAPSG